MDTAGIVDTLVSHETEGTLSFMDTLLRLDIESLPQDIVWAEPVSDEMLERLCEVNDLLQLERTKEGVIRVNPPTGLLTGDGNREIIHQLSSWWKSHRRGRVTASDTGFHLKDSSMLSPDAAYISPGRLQFFSKKQKGFPHLCPDFVIELLSESDRIKDAQRKMEDWIDNGVLLGWLIDPYKKTVLVYVPDAPLATIAGDTVDGTGPVEGFTLDLAEVWRCYE